MKHLSKSQNDISKKIHQKKAFQINLFLVDEETYEKSPRINVQVFYVNCACAICTSCALLGHYRFMDNALVLATVDNSCGSTDF